MSNPPGRFDRQEVAQVDDEWYMEESPESIATTLEPERAREVITTNDSPDVPFEKSINPYRGCETGCVYCALPETPVLMADGTTRELRKLRVGDWIYGTLRKGWLRHFEKTQVLARWNVIRPAHRITLEDGTQLTVGADHRFLTERGWKFITGSEQGRGRRAHLTVNNKLMGTGAFASAVVKDQEYRSGYLCGIIRGDGTMGSYTSTRASGAVSHGNLLRLALCDFEALARARTWLSHAYVETSCFAFSAAAGRPMQAIATSTRDKLSRIRELIAWPGAPSRLWQAGFLAGIFDVEGSFSCGILRVSNSDDQIIRRLTDALSAFSFRYVIEHAHHEHRKPVDVVRVVGGLREHLRFFHTVDPAIMRKRDIAGQAVRSAAKLRVVAIEPLGRAMRLVDITTGTGDYISNGVVSHNCYARPSHAYMGLSPGIDFETRLFYKVDAAVILEKQLAQRSYVCKPITLGANTDPYQPVERRMKVTRSILEVLARTRHPVTIITKHALVLRDLDILTDMAREKLVSVAVSVTTLDDELKRALEPRAASPGARLRAIGALNAAGVPAGVLVAPVIPALTDHDLEGILEAAAKGGAPWAGYVLLRLPYEIKDLFREWLAEHYPQRAAHVMSVLRDMRGGRDNDPRFGTRMKGTGPYAELLRNRFKVAVRRLNLNNSTRDSLNTRAFTPPSLPGAQLNLGL
ncbi:MAG TPA: PA0069 family radical SAM protein [Steroidobacteraceae bacterium]|nr:PA0069 family radical SAM protein [Steroidobacteraceae bacterium]